MNKQELIAKIMERVNGWESSEKGEFIVELLGYIDPVTLNLICKQQKIDTGASS